MWHRLKHKLGLNPARLVRIIHTEACPGFCFSMGLPQCKWNVELECTECGKHSFLDTLVTDTTFGKENERGDI